MGETAPSETRAWPERSDASGLIRAQVAHGPADGEAVPEKVGEPIRTSVHDRWMPSGSSSSVSPRGHPPAGSCWSQRPPGRSSDAGPRARPSPALRSGRRAPARGSRGYCRVQPSRSRARSGLRRRPSPGGSAIAPRSYPCSIEVQRRSRRAKHSRNGSPTRQGTRSTD